mgnify:FL=1
MGEISTKRPDYFIAVSKYVRNNWLKLYPSIKKEKIEVIYPGIESDKFIRKDVQKSFDVLFVGRFISIKGINDLIDAISLIKIPLKICLVGTGPERRNIIKKILKLNLNDKFSIVSNINDNSLINFYNAAKITVFPSYAKEGVLLTMLEAASCGCAIITSNSCSMPEFLKNNRNGLLFKPKDPKDLASKIIKLLLDDRLRLSLGKNAEKDIRNKWDNKIRIKELINKYYKFWRKNARSTF